MGANHRQFDYRLLFEQSVAACALLTVQVINATFASVARRHREKQAIASFRSELGLQRGFFCVIIPICRAVTSVHYELPAPNMTFDVALEDGTKILVRRHGRADGARLFLSHGNGFAADAYFPYWQYLLAKFDLIVFDFRNHGQNVPVVPPHHHYEQLTCDLERVIDAVKLKLGERRTAGLFHSMSARTAMKHAIEIGWRWDALVLFDPPNVPPPAHPLYPTMAAFEKSLVDWALRRRRSFAVVDELVQEYLQLRAAARWVSGEHELMARSVLRKSPDGNGYELVCDPENEAGIYAQAMALNLWPRASEFGGPVKLIGCDPKMKGGTGPVLILTLT
jgi:pimeloyl-ACP methyl ester carboxylesterase